MARSRGRAWPPPCTTFSIANNSSGPIRSKEFPRGIPGIPARKQLKVDRGNELLDITIKIVSWLAAAKIPFVVEQPLSSYMWSDPAFLRALDSAEARLVKVDQCAFGTRHRKPTCLAFSGAELDLGTLGCSDTARCSGRHGYCSFTRRRHIWLQGASTRKAPAFPPKLAYAIARCLLSPQIIARAELFAAP